MKQISTTVLVMTVGVSEIRFLMMKWTTNICRPDYIEQATKVSAILTAILQKYYRCSIAIVIDNDNPENNFNN